jgi:hypothetical protein
MTIEIMKRIAFKHTMDKALLTIVDFCMLYLLRYLHFHDDQPIIRFAEHWVATSDQMLDTDHL